MRKPFSQACENNQEPILQKIKPLFQDSTHVLEIGSGTGQHACYFAKHLPHLTWQPTDREENLSSINCSIDAAYLANLPKSLALDVKDQLWPCQPIHAVFTANTLHIMHWSEVEYFFSGLKKFLSSQGIICLYGPFNYHQQYTSTSNQQFDTWLKARDSNSGIRDIEAVTLLAQSANLVIIDDFSMPANNRLLVLQKNGT